MNAVAQAPRVPGRWRRWVRRSLVVVAVLLACAVAIRLWPHRPLSQDLPQSVAVHDRNGALLRLALADDERYRLWLPLSDIAPTSIEAVLLHEDAWFRRHPGINPASIVRAAWSTYARGHPRIGGSTITMQLARLRWRLRTHTPGGKLQQMLRAVQLELC
ncbi:MAG: transglycosylase domain-containing protein, partial [Lysobacter sp.]|nr:transglycosylase domain-containing protein [Lysobacter sp.]